MYQELIKRIARELRKEHVDYYNSKYIFKQARKLAGIHPPKKKRSGTVKRLSQEELEAFTNAAFKHSPTTGLMMLTMYTTAARVNEFVNLTPEDIYVREEVIIIAEGKGGKRREVPVDAGLIRAILIHLSGRRQGYIFETQRHDKYTSRRIQQIVKQIAQEAGIRSDLTPHMLRHTRATDLAEKGVSTDIIQQLLGHSKSETTMIYTHTAQRNVKEAIKAIQQDELIEKLINF